MIIFSMAKTTPSLHRMPIAVPPFSTAFTAYSTCRLAGKYNGQRVDSDNQVWYLEVSSVWREDRVREIVASSYRRLQDRGDQHAYSSNAKTAMEKESVPCLW